MKTPPTTVSIINCIEKTKPRKHPRRRPMKENFNIGGVRYNILGWYPDPRWLILLAVIVLSVLGYIFWNDFDRIFDSLFTYSDPLTDGVKRNFAR